MRRSRSSCPITLVLCAILLATLEAGASTRGQAEPVRAEGSHALQSAAHLVQQGRLDEAELQARRALGDPATQAAAYSVLGTISFQRKHLDESVDLFKKAIQLDDQLVGAHLSLAQVYTLQGKPALALPVFERVLKMDPSNANARLGVAWAAMDAGEYQRSMEVAGPLMAEWTPASNVPSDLAIKFGVLFATHGQAPQAIEILERIRKATGSSYELAFNLAGAYLVNNDPVRALEHYDGALAQKPDSVPALRQAAAVAEQHGELERSLSYWLRAKKIEPEDPEILLGFGRVCLKMDLLEDADPALAKAASARPDDRTYQYTLAAAKVGRKQFEAAQHLIAPLVEKQPTDPLLQYALGSIFYLEGQLNEAAAHLRESLRLQPDQLAADYYLALVVRDQGNDAEAIARLEKLLQRVPDHAASCEALGGLLMTVQRYDEAERQLRNAIRLNPKLVKANYQLGLLLARTGRKEEAERQLAVAKSLREEDEASSRLQLRLLDPGQ
ncbi:MAG TPA: tetratricopeptide repeat protein [Vicinamibacterales bacterium]